MLDYTNRFLAIAATIRTLIKEQKTVEHSGNLSNQLKSLKKRLTLIKNMQMCGAVSFLLALLSMYFIYIENLQYANFFFIISMLAFVVSLLLSVTEIYASKKALEIALHAFEKGEE
ncbi:DUF2721 domain-containing protein [Chryseobacterium wanjuense]